MRLAILLATLLAAAPAAAGNNNELTFGGFSRSLRSDSANAVTEENLGGPQWSYARQLHLDLVSRLQIWATAGYALSSADGTVFDMTTEISTHVLTLGGRARYVLHPNLALVGRVDVGTNHTSLTLEGNNHTVSDGAWGGVAGAALGADLLLFAKERFSLGVRFELGYLTATAVDLAPAAAAMEDVLVLDAMQASIGHLDLGGRYFSISALAAF